MVDCQKGPPRVPRSLGGFFALKVIQIPSREELVWKIRGFLIPQSKRNNCYPPDADKYHAVAGRVSKIFETSGFSIGNQQHP